MSTLNAIYDPIHVPTIKLTYHDPTIYRFSILRENIFHYNNKNKYVYEVSLFLLQYRISHMIDDDLIDIYYDKKIIKLKIYCNIWYISIIDQNVSYLKENHFGTYCVNINTDFPIQYDYWRYHINIIYFIKSLFNIKKNEK